MLIASVVEQFDVIQSLRGVDWESRNLACKHGLRKSVCLWVIVQIGELSEFSLFFAG